MVVPSSIPVQFHPVEPDRPFLLAADVDGTLLGDEEGQAGIKALFQEYAGSLLLAVITGRTVASVLGLIQVGQLPLPDFICGCVGTELLACRDAENRFGERYAARVSPEWNLETVYRLGEGEGIRRQVFAEGQPRFQAGFDWDGQPAALAAFCQRLSHLPDCRILPSSNCYIDVFPQRVGKGEAVRFLQRELELDPERVVVAGDTGNDREMFETEFRGILPANALEELKTAACQPWHYQSGLPAARGVLDGLLHFGFIKKVGDVSGNGFGI